MSLVVTESNPDTNRTMTTLPTEIITQEIFTKLPAQSLVRFKCVSKLYYALISSPKFIDLHLQQSLSSKSTRLFILTERYNNINLTLIEVDSQDSAIVTIPVQHCFENWCDGALSIVGTINGLVCVGQEGVLARFDHIVINPSTGAYRSIPHRRTRTTDSIDVEVSFGFGYDDINCDYKLVRIAEDLIIDNPYVDNDYIDREVIVFSLKKNSWTLAEKLSLHESAGSLNIAQNGVLVNNYLLHWVFRIVDGFQERYEIRSFDVRFNKWANDVPLMDILTDTNLTNKEHRDNKVCDLTHGVVDGCLCVCINTKLSRNVWVMKEYGVKESWIKLFEMPIPIDLYEFLSIGPFGFCRGSKQELLVRSEYNSGLFWCDIGLGTLDSIEEIEDVPIFEQACLLTGSLVPIPGDQKLSLWE